MTAPEVSHGRGGAGNINPDDTKYIDGEIVRAGTPGSQGAGAFSTGRGDASLILPSQYWYSAQAHSRVDWKLKNTSEQISLPIEPGCEFSECDRADTSRIGDGNIGDKGIEPAPRTDGDIVPEAAVRPSEEEDVHTGRGGAGNVHLGPEHKKKRVVDGATHEESSASHESVADKLKHKVMGVFKK